MEVWKDGGLKMLLFHEGGDFNMLYITLELDKTKNIFGGFAATNGDVQTGGMIGLGFTGVCCCTKHDLLEFVVNYFWL